MEMTKFFSEQLERETAASRKVLERVPEGRNDWKPHERSMPMGYLAALVAQMPAWIAMMVNQDELDLKSPGAAKLRAPEWSQRTELVTALDASLAQAREALANTTDEHLLAPWRFLVGGQVVDESPRHVMIADSVFSHLAHHRGQLTVYLRLKEESAAEVYQPSANEGLVA